MRKLLADQGLPCFEAQGETDSNAWKILRHRALFKKKKGSHFSMAKTNMGKMAQNKLAADPAVKTWSENHPGLFNKAAQIAMMTFKVQ